MTLMFLQPEDGPLLLILEVTILLDKGKCNWGEPQVPQPLSGATWQWIERTNGSAKKNTNSL